MTHTNLIDRLRAAPVGLKPPQIISKWRSEREEAAALIEQQEAVIASLIGALSDIAAHETSEKDNRNLNDLIANESVKAARAALLAAKTYLEE